MPRSVVGRSCLTSRRAGAYSIIQHRRSIHKVIRQFWSASFPCFHVGQMSSLETPHNKTGSRIWFDVEWFGTSLGQPEICPRWSAPSWCWSTPPAPSSRSPCPSPTRAPPPCQRHADTCLVTCSGQPWVATIVTNIATDPDWWFLLHHYSLLMQWSVNKILFL